MRTQRIRTHKEHGVGNLMLTDAASKNDDASFSCLDAEVVEFTNVFHQVDDESRRLVRVEVQHVSKRAVGQSRAEYRDLVLRGEQLSEDCNHGHADHGRAHLGRPVEHAALVVDLQS